MNRNTLTESQRSRWFSCCTTDSAICVTGNEWAANFVDEENKTLSKENDLGVEGGLSETGVFGMIKTVLSHSWASSSSDMFFPLRLLRGSKFLI